MIPPFDLPSSDIQNLNERWRRHALKFAVMTYTDGPRYFLFRASTGTGIDRVVGFEVGNYETLAEAVSAANARVGVTP